MTDTKPVSVRGGSAGIEAHGEELLQLAQQCGAAGRATAEQALVLHGYLIHPAVAAGAMLDPIGAADFTGELLRALDGGSGLSWQAVVLGVLDVGLRGAVIAYAAADRIEQGFLPSIEGVYRVPIATVHSATGLRQGHYRQALNQFITSDPEALDLAVTTLTGFWSGYGLTRLMAAYPDGRAEVTRTAVERDEDPPRSLPALLSDLAGRNRGRAGDIDVRVVTGPDGTRRVIVDIPGTKSWNPSPRTPDVTSLGTNLRSIQGTTTTYEEGVLQALRQAGVRPSDDVLLVGHSQGGMVAVVAANRASQTGEFHISHVIAAGAPLAQIAVARSVQVLAIENEGDVVPHSDGGGNPDRTNLTTVTVHRNQDDIEANHSLEKSYLPGAGDIAASGQRSVVDFLSGLSPFLAGGPTRTEVFHIERR